MWRKLAHFDYALDSLKCAASGMFCTLNALRMDSILIRAHRSIAFRTSRTHSNRHGNLYPLKQLGPFLQSLQRVVYLKIEFVSSIIRSNFYHLHFDLMLTFSTASAFWSKHCVIIIDTIDFIIHINGKWNSIQTLIADTAAKATGMIRFAHCLENLKKKTKGKMLERVPL